MLVMKVKEVKARKGTKEPWVELLIEKEDGTQVKMIARKVARFWSEKQEESGDVI